MKTCPKCLGAFDLDALPAKRSELPQTLTTPKGVQSDISCPACGTLLERDIDGVKVTASFKDNRAEVQRKLVAATAKIKEKADAAQAAAKAKILADEEKRGQEPAE